MRTIKIGFLAILTLLTVSFSAHAKDYELCTVTTESDYKTDNDTNHVGYMRNYLEEVLKGTNSEYNFCVAPASDAASGFDHLIMFETKEWQEISHVNVIHDIDDIQLKAQVNLTNLSGEVAVGNYTPDMLTDNSVDSGIDYSKFTGSIAGDYGTVVIRAGEYKADGTTKSNFTDGEQPFKCGTKGNIYLRNVILNTYGVKKADLDSCVRDGGEFEVCEGKLVERTTTSGDIGTGTMTMSRMQISGMALNTSILANIQVAKGGGVASTGNGTTEDNTSYNATNNSYTSTRNLNDEYACETTKYHEICGDGLDNDGDGQTDEGCETPAVDNDGDGVDTTSDCDDNDANNFPGNTEVCDGQDNDCDGDIDEGVTTTYYPDADGDTYGDLNSTGTAACTAPTGFVTDHTDCNDVVSSGEAINPAATEVCDGVDNNCDGQIDEGMTTTTYYTDADGDTYGNASSPVTACSQPAGTVTDSTDCSDSDATVHPGATDTCADGIDQDCSGTDSSVSCTTATEICDGIDNNGDGSIDEGFNDTDGDGTANCVDTETCDGIDNNGDGTIDEGFDINGDGLADCIEFGNEQCADGLDNDSDGLTDCLDDDCASDTSCNGKGPETSCDNQTDDDGDGFTDCEDSDCGLDAACLPTDADGDGYDSNADCNDARSDVNPNMPESCSDDIDNNCDGATNEGCSVGTPETDDDGDQYCDDVNGDGLCDDGSLAGDCDDSNADINPAATESTSADSGVCGDDIDQNCDGIDPVCEDTPPLNPNGAITGGGCGCDLKANSTASGRDLAQAILALIPMLLVGFLRQRAKGFKA
jgi:hypothetical protein